MQHLDTPNLLVKILLQSYLNNQKKKAVFIKGYQNMLYLVVIFVVDLTKRYFIKKISKFIKNTHSNYILFVIYYIKFIIENVVAFRSNFC